MSVYSSDHTILWFRVQISSTPSTLFPIKVKFCTLFAIASRKGTNGSPGLAVMGQDSCSKVMGSNPGAVYWMNIFSQIFVGKLYVCLKIRNKRKEADVGPFLKKNIEKVHF